MSKVEEEKLMHGPELRCTARGKHVDAATAPEGAPTNDKLPDGQLADHYVLCESERAKGFVEPVRNAYVHVGRAGPKYPLRDLTDEERERLGPDIVKYEPYPESARPALGHIWSQADLDKVGKGCGVRTTIPRSIAETYAREPGYYGSTFCCGCGDYFPVGRDGEFVWEGTTQRVGTRKT